MENQTYRNCKHFHQHYGLDGERIFRMQCGHCGQHRLRIKKPYQAACTDFEQGEDKEKEFVSKAYLSRTLLDWIRQLELLPEIQEDDSI